MFHNSKEGWKNEAHSRSERLEQVFEKAPVSNAYAETDNCQCMIGLITDLKDAYFHVSIAPRHRKFLRFALKDNVYKYLVLPFGLSLAPRTFTRHVESAISLLRQQGIRIVSYLDIQTFWV